MLLSHAISEYIIFLNIRYLQHYSNISLYDENEVYETANVQST